MEKRKRLRRFKSIVIRSKTQAGYNRCRQGVYDYFMVSDTVDAGSAIRLTGLTIKRGWREYCRQMISIKLICLDNAGYPMFVAHSRMSGMKLICLKTKRGQDKNPAPV